MANGHDLDIPKAFRIMLAVRNLRQYEMGEALGMSKQAISGYLKKKDFRVNADVVKVADILDYDVKLVFTDRESGKQFEID